MIRIADIHCHILPYVDDGAEQKEESMALLESQFQQGVRVICVTPHLRRGMFETPDEVVLEQFERMQERARAFEGKMHLYLSREYYCDSSFVQRVEAGNVIPMGNGEYLLTEFSTRYSKEEAYEFIKLIRKAGYRPLIAHVERFPELKDLKCVERMIHLGAKIQVNAGSLLGREGILQALWTRRLIKNHLVHVVASDAHDTETRPPELGKVAKYLKNFVGEAETKNLLYENPLTILNLTRRR